MLGFFVLSSDAWMFGPKEIKQLLSFVKKASTTKVLQ